MSNAIHDGLETHLFIDSVGAHAWMGRLHERYVRSCDRRKHCTPHDGEMSGT